MPASFPDSTQLERSCRDRPVPGDVVAVSDFLGLDTPDNAKILDSWLHCTDELSGAREFFLVFVTYRECRALVRVPHKVTLVVEVLCSLDGSMQGVGRSVIADPSKAIVNKAPPLHIGFFAFNVVAESSHDCIYSKHRPWAALEEAASPLYWVIRDRALARKPRSAVFIKLVYEAAHFFW